MRAIFKLILGILCALAVMDAAAAQTAFYRAPPSAVAGQPGTLVRQEVIDGAPLGATAYRVLYRSTGWDDKPILVLEAGAAGYLLKDMAADKLADAVRRVQSGLRVIDPELAAEAWVEADPLTDRERQVLRLAGDGMASIDIADKLNLSEGTVRNYLSEAMSKLGAGPDAVAKSTWTS